jgi:hypothetical protein
MRLVPTTVKIRETHMMVVNSALKTLVSIGREMLVMLASMVTVIVPSAIVAMAFHL